MKFDPKADVSFQKALQEILKGVVPFTPIATEAPKLELPQVELTQHQASKSDVSEVKVLKKKGVWVSVEKFTDLRIQFFWTHCFPKNYKEGEAEAAFQAYCAVRDTPEAQGFLKENEASFARLHDALCRAAISARKQKRQLVT